MTVDSWMHKTALVASYLWEFRALASHAERLALLRLARHRAEFAAGEVIEQEMTRLRAVLDQFQQLEERLPRSSRPLVQGALREWAQQCANVGNARSAGPDNGTRTHSSQSRP